TQGDNLRGLERAVAIAQEHANAVVVLIHRYDIEVAIVVEVGRGQGFRNTESPRAAVGGGLKGGVPVAKHHAHGTPADICHGQVENSGVVEVAHHQARGAATKVGRGDAYRGLERAVAVAEQNARPAARGVRDDQVEGAIAMEVRGRQTSVK